MLDNPLRRIDDELQTHHNNPDFLFFLFTRKAEDYKTTEK
jgi:hypothetical protein